MHYFLLEIKHLQKVNENGAPWKVKKISYQVSFAFKVLRIYMLGQVLKLRRCFANAN